MAIKGRGYGFAIDPAGLARFKSQIEKLPKEVQKKVALKAFRYAGKPMLQTAKNLCTSDRVEKTIKGVTRTAGGVKGYLMGPQSGFPNPFWIEYGTLSQYQGSGRKHKQSWTMPKTVRFTTKSGDWITVKAGTVFSKGITPRPYMRPAWDQTKSTIEKRMAEKLGKEIVKLAKNGK